MRQKDNNECIISMKYFSKILLFLAIIFLPFFVYADTTAPATDLSTTCQQISANDNSCQNLSAADCQAILQKCADYYDNQSASIAQDITKTTQQKNTLQNQVSALKKKITGLEDQITQGTLMVKDLNSQISDTSSSIDNTSTQIQDSQNQIAAILQEVYEQQQKSSFVILLQGNLF